MLPWRDKGNIKQDIRNSFNEKKGNITVKFTNFCSKNYLAPLDVKLRVLNSCVVSSLLYSCETWAGNIPNEIEVMYRIGIKTALNIRNSSCNEIVYIESGLFPLICRVQKLQLGFWRMIQNSSCQYVTNLIASALELNIPYIQYYVELSTKFSSSKICQCSLKQQFREQWKAKITDTFNIDEDSKLGS